MFSSASFAAKLENYHPPARAAREPHEDTLHRQLNVLNHARLTPSLGEDGEELPMSDEVALRRLERAFVEAERAAIADVAAKAPQTPDAFIAWFEGLRDHGPGQGDPLFPWLAADATLDEVRWFLKQEVAGEAGFDDLVALTQLRLPARAKLEMARNYWDEMGQGHAGGMHGPMLDALARALRVEEVPGPIVWEAQALSNLLVALAANRRYAYQAVGALGVVELTAPDRSANVNEGLRRLGIGAAERRYFALHATLDRKHSASWNSEVLWSLVEGDPRTAALMAEGALMRLSAGARCFSRYRSELGVNSSAV